MDSKKIDYKNPRKLNKYFLLFAFLLPLISTLIRYLQYDLILDKNLNYDSFFFNSDAIFYSLVSKDIILSGGKYFDWIFAAAPEIFPTMLITYIISLFTSNYFFNQIIFILIQQFIIFYLIFRLTSLFTNNLFAVFSTIIVNMLLTFILHFKPFNYIFLASHHIGSLIGVLLSLLLYYHYNFKKLYQILIINLVVFLFTFSNPLYIGHFVAPMVILNIIISFYNKRKIIIYEMLPLVTASIAYVIKGIVYAHDNDCNICMSTYANVDKIKFSYELFINSLYHIKEFYLHHSSILQNLFVFSFILCPLLYLINIFFNKKGNLEILSQRTHFYLFVLTSFITSHLPIVFTSPNIQFRYMNNVYFLTLIIIPIFIYPYLKENFTKTIFPSLFVFLVAFSLSLKEIDLNKQLHSNYYPEDIQVIDQILKEYNLNHGIGLWWYANRLVFLSKRVVTMIPCHNIKPLHWDTKTTWIEMPPEFIINLDPDVIGYKYSKLIEVNNIKLYIIS